MQLAEPRTQIALDPVIVQFVPVSGADGVFIARAHGLLPIIAFP